MRYALVNGQRQEAQPNLSGECPHCDSPMVAKCGELRVRHWAHNGRRHCDPSAEDETEWHRAWQDQFPVDWQEIRHLAADGELHIADVKTNRGWVIEFQHSYLKPEERRSRDGFYPRLIWVVNGTRRKRDGEQLLRAWNEGVPVGANSTIRRTFSDECVLLREWIGSRSPIFFDLGEEKPLWWLFARSTSESAYVAPYSRAKFIEGHRVGATEIAAREFDEFVNDIPKLVAEYESRAAMPRPPPPFMPNAGRRHGRFRRF
jgi:competence protein CoiA